MTTLKKRVSDIGDAKRKVIGKIRASMRAKKIGAKLKETITPKAVIPKPVPKLDVVAFYQMSLGSDPEFFFKTDDKGIIGAEKILAKKGLVVPGYAGLSDPQASKFVIDGVQAELNPRPGTCRASISHELTQCFMALKTELEKNKGVSLDFSRSVEIPETNLMELDKENQKLGCMPSKTVYEGKAGVKLTDVDPLKHRQRSAGGHIHIGSGGYAQCASAIKSRPADIVKMLDIICGNTCVLLDRDEGNKIRRKLYGRAGEYRLPKHGIEYRTLSNFWLEAYPLMSFAFGMARLAMQLMSDTPEKVEAYFKAFTEAVDMDDIQTAINENDFDLAYSNFKKIEPLLIQVCTANREGWPINAGNMPQFHYFVKRVQEVGTKHYFPQDVITHWTAPTYQPVNPTTGQPLPTPVTLVLPNTRIGFHDFLRLVIHAEMLKKKTEEDAIIKKEEIAF